MKKVFIVLTAATLVACTKESGNTGILKADTAATNQTTVRTIEKAPEEKTFRYVAEDGSSAHVTFGNAADGKFISIRSNNKTIRVKHDEQTATGDLYREHDITVTAEGDQVTIDQAGTVIELRKAAGE